MLSLVSVSHRATAQDFEPTHQVILTDGTELPLPQDAVASILPFREGAEVGADPWIPDANRTRYFYTPSAFCLGFGKGYIAQRFLVLSSMGIGVLPFLDVELGIVLPTVFIQDAIVGFAGTKASFVITTSFQCGVGGQVLFFGGNTIAIAFINASLGIEDRHITVATGPGIMYFENLNASNWIASISGNYRIGPGATLVSENWVVFFLDNDGPWGGPFIITPSGGIRLFGKQFSVDIGLIPYFTGDHDIPFIPIPLVSLTWNW